MFYLSRYYTLADFALVHYAAVALNPEMKFDYFSTEWQDRQDWIRNAEKEVHNLWTTEYKFSLRERSGLELPLRHSNNISFRLSLLNQATPVYPLLSLPLSLTFLLLNLEPFPVGKKISKPESQLTSLFPMSASFKKRWRMNSQPAHCSIGLTGEATGIRRSWQEWEWKYSVFRQCLPTQRGSSAGMLLCPPSLLY